MKLRRAFDTRYKRFLWLLVVAAFVSHLIAACVFCEQGAASYFQREKLNVPAYIDVRPDVINAGTVGQGEQPCRWRLYHADRPRAESYEIQVICNALEAI